MIYLNLKTSTLRAPEYIGSEPTQRGTWLNLMCYCCEQENGGVIDGCAGWKDRQWQQTAGVTLAEVREDCDLWKWDGETLVVTFYPSDKQAEVQARREAGRLGGKLSGKARRRSKNEANLQANREAPLEGVVEAHLERKGKERKVKEKEVGRNVAEVSATNDSDWLKELADNPAYRAINVEAELGKMTAWCAANGKQRTRRRFVNWLNRAERPIAITAQGHNGLNGGRKPATAWELKQSIEAAQKEASRLEGDPQNKEPIDPETPWDRRLKPSVAVKVKELRGRAQELTSKLALLGKEAA
jgi:hypothetical protein